MDINLQSRGAMLAQPLGGGAVSSNSLWSGTSSSAYGGCGSDAMIPYVYASQIPGMFDYDELGMALPEKNHHQILLIHGGGGGGDGRDQGKAEQSTEYQQQNSGRSFHQGLNNNGKSRQPTAEFGNLVVDESKRKVLGQKSSCQGSTVSVIEQEIQRIKEETLKRQSLHLEQHLQDLNYQRYLVEQAEAYNRVGFSNPVSTMRQSSSAKPFIDSRIPQQIAPAPQFSSRTVDINEKRDQLNCFDQQLVAQSQSTQNYLAEVSTECKIGADIGLVMDMVCDTRIKRMKNLLQEAKKKIGVQATAGAASTNEIEETTAMRSDIQAASHSDKRLSHDQDMRKIKEDSIPCQQRDRLISESNFQGFANSEKAASQKNEDIEQWRSDLEMVRESLRRLQDEKLVLQRPTDEVIVRKANDTTSRASTDKGQFYEHNIKHDVQTQNSDEVMADDAQKSKQSRFDSDEVYLAYLGKEPSIQLSQSRQEAFTPTAYQTAPAPSISLAPTFFVNGLPVQAQQSSCQRHRDESIERRVKEAKVNLEWKIALKLKQKMTSEAPIQEEAASTATPVKDDEPKWKNLPGHIVKTLQKSRQNATKHVANISSSSHSTDHFSSQLAQQSVESLQNAKNNVKFKNASATKTPLKVFKSAGTHGVGSPQTNTVTLKNLHLRQKEKVFKVSRPNSPDNQDLNIDSTIKGAKPIKIIQRVQRTTAVSKERGVSTDSKDINLTTPQKKLTVVKMIKPPISGVQRKDKLVSSPPQIIAYRKSYIAEQAEAGMRSCSTAKKPSVPVQDKKQLRLVSSSLGAHKRNQSSSVGPVQKNTLTSQQTKQLQIKTSSVLKFKSDREKTPPPTSSLRSTILQPQRPSTAVRGKSPPASTSHMESNSRNQGMPFTKPRGYSSVTGSVSRKPAPDTLPFKPSSTQSTTTQNKNKSLQGSGAVSHHHHQPFIANKKQPSSISKAKPTQIQAEITNGSCNNNDWVKNCDDKIMRFIATSPSKNTKSVLLGGSRMPINGSRANSVTRNSCIVLGSSKQAQTVSVDVESLPEKPVTTTISE